MKLLEVNKDKQFLQKHVGSLSQIAGLKRYEFIEGKAKGVEAVDVKTGSGLVFTVLPGRGMDIAWAEFQGVPFGYMSKTGVVSPVYYESKGLDWLRTFFAGLLTTCGLSNVGVPDEETHPVLGRQSLGLHGRISNMAAERVCVQEEWVSDEYVMTVSGCLREATLHGENMVLKRTVRTTLGSKSLFIHDVVENEGSVDRPLMLLYHINIGYPLVDKASRLVCNSHEIIPRGDRSLEEKELYDRMRAPVKSEPEQLFFHDFKTDEKGMTCCGIVHPDLEFGVYIRYKKEQLPNFSQWKMMAEAEYVTGLEPGNCNPVGRTETAGKDKLEYLRPGEKKEIDLEIGVLSTPEEINAFIKTVASLQ